MRCNCDISAKNKEYIDVADDLMGKKIVIVTGLSGAGKTTLLNMLKPNKYKIINVGTLMKDELHRRRVNVDRDTIKKLDSAELSRLRNIIFSKISKIDGNVVLDTHVTVENGLGVSPGIPYSTLKFLGGLSAFVYVNALSEEIMERRRKDKSRKREKEGIFFII